MIETADGLQFRLNVEQREAPDRVTTSFVPITESQLDIMLRLMEAHKSAFRPKE